MKYTWIFVLLTGGACSFIGYKKGYLDSKKKYEDLADREVASVKEAILSGRYNTKDIKPVKHKESADTVINKLANGNFRDGVPSSFKNEKVNYNSQYNTVTSADRIPGIPKHMATTIEDRTVPFIMAPDEFQESPNEAITLYLCSDNVLLDDSYNEIQDIKIVGGFVLLDQMGKYESDCLIISNPLQGIDYEILTEERPSTSLVSLDILESE